jgi:hypothetical protein
MAKENDLSTRTLYFQILLFAMVKSYTFQSIGQQKICAYGGLGGHTRWISSNFTIIVRRILSTTPIAIMPATVTAGFSVADVFTATTTVVTITIFHLGVTIPPAGRKSSSLYVTAAMG